MIQNTTRSRGRPRSFDEREALEKATQVFWSKGYDGVTIDDLVPAGMHRDNGTHGRLETSQSCIIQARLAMRHSR